MNSDTPATPRSIPPQPTMAWFLRDLVPDGLWNEVDIGTVAIGQARDVQQSLVEHGGSDAWLRFVEQTRVALPQILSISLFEAIGYALYDQAAWPKSLWLHCRPVLSVYAAGRLLTPTITLGCHARLAFKRAGEPRTGEYVLAETEVTLRHAGRSLIERVTGEYFVPAPPAANVPQPASARSRSWFKGFGTHRLP